MEVVAADGPPWLALDFAVVFGKGLEQSRLERDTELKRQTQIRVAWCQPDHVRVDVRLNSDFPEQFGKFAPRLAAQAGKDLGEQSDQPLGCGCRGIEVPRAQVPLLLNEFPISPLEVWRPAGISGSWPPRGPGASLRRRPRRAGPPYDETFAQIAQA